MSGSVEPPVPGPYTGSPSEEPDGGLAAFLAPSLDPLFSRPVRRGVDSAWYCHLPFAAWLVRTLRPALLVELGTGAGVSYAGFCESVMSSGLSTRCYAVDRWAGDAPAGIHGDAVIAELGSFHDSRYGVFSRLLRLSPAEASSRFEDNSIDLLHMDGHHRFEQAAENYDAWKPRLSPQAVVLLHGTNDRDGDQGVRRLWSSLRARHPGFEFPHGQGLGVLAPGTVPPALRFLFGLDADPVASTRLRNRFALLGERWEADHARVLDARAAAALSERAGAAEALAAELHRSEAERTRQAAEADASGQALGRLGHAHDRLRDELATAKAERHRLLRETAGLRADQDAADGARDRLAAGLDQARQALTAAHAAQAGAQRQARAEHDGVVHALLRLQGELAEAHGQLAASRQAATERQHVVDALHGSASWRLTRPLRSLAGLLRQPSQVPGPPERFFPPAGLAQPLPPVLPAPEPTLPPLPEPKAPAEPQAEPEAEQTAAPAGWRPVRRILFVAGEPGTPGATYRTRRAAAACAAAGYDTEVVDIAGVAPDNLLAADLVLLWRAGWSGHVATMLELARAARTRVAFDVDDLIVQPALAVAEIIDGLRTTFVSEAEGRSYFQAMQRTLTSCDLCVTTTAELAAGAGAMHPVVHVIPNGFDEAAERASRHAVRLRAERPSDGRVRIGYAGGTRTHQKDFSVVAGALARVLEQRPDTLLVLFRDGRSGEGLLLVEEFPELVPHASRIEWRDAVPLAELPAELARFDVSLCPLERNNPFCESKSELKYFESALAGVCLVATPTGPFRRAVQHGVTGFLPEDAAGWEQALLQLVDDPALRRQVARAAFHDCLWQFGPRRQAELWALLLRGLDGGADGARAGALAIGRGAYRSAGLPEVPDSRVLFSHDALGEARVTVGMTSFNYEAHLGEALQSVLDQTMESIDLVVVDDGSRDGSVALLLDWAARNRLRFNRLRILETASNAGLGGARNVVFDQAETPWVTVLDSDNRLAPDACARMLAALDAEPLAAFAYPRLRQFGGGDAVMGAEPFDPQRLKSGNYIDAMATVAKWAWAAGGGYYVRRDAMGWEDFSLWCRLVELGQFGVPVADELAFYRVHPGSMVNAITEQDENKRRMVGFVEARHPWLRLRMRATRKRS